MDDTKLKRIFADVKEEMADLVQRMEYESSPTYMEQLKAAISILESLPKLSGSRISSVYDAPTVEGEPKEASGEECEEQEDKQLWPPDLSEKENEVPSKEDNIFRRSLSGGYINDRYISEKIVRTIGIEHGDKASVTEVEEGRIYVSIIEKGPGLEPEGRVQINFCKVQVENEQHFVEKYFDQDGYYPLPIGKVDIPEPVAKWLSIQEDDNVDIAYNEHQPENVKIIWKHNIPAPQYRSSTPLTQSINLKQLLSENEEASESNYDLGGKTVLVMGGDTRHPDYRDAIQKANGKFIGMPGSATAHQMKIAVNKADVAVLIATGVRTHPYEWAQRVCKEENIPFTRVHNNGIDTVLRAALDPKYPANE